jgi:hypothetical protein
VSYGSKTTFLSRLEMMFQATKQIIPDTKLNTQAFVLIDFFNCKK